MAGISLTTI